MIPERLRTSTLLLAAAAWATAGAFAQDAQDAPDAQDASGPEALFAANCASCHGEKGDGDGWTELERPARSFRDGGFSYGNTPTALFRTISIGIPGTQMPGFDTSLTEDERRALAEHVITLGPEVREVTTEETILVVGERPQVVRGLLPPITEGAASHPRGLLIGTTDGLTFEYRTDDVRLLGVRQGAFVRRADWTGRGGSALEPLGKVVHVMEQGAPGATFRRPTTDGPVDLAARLRGTWIRGRDAGLTYELREPGGRRVARVRERTRALGTSVGTGFRRRFALDELAGSERIWIRAGVRGRDGSNAELRAASPTLSERLWEVIPREDGTFECVGLPHPSSDGRTGVVSVAGVTYVELAPGGNAIETEVVTVVTPTWSEEFLRTIAEAAER